MKWHFAHYHAEECDIVTASETALHFLAKDVISEARCLALPSIDARVSIKDVLGMVHEKSRTVPSRIAAFDRVDQEVDVDWYRVDLRAFAGRKPLVIEIRVTHAVDETKRAYFAQREIAAVELDLSKVQRDIRPKELAALLTESDSTASWLYCPKLTALQQDLLMDLKASVVEHNHEIVARQAELEERQRREKEAIDRRRARNRMAIEDDLTRLTRYLEDGELDGPNEYQRWSNSLKSRVLRNLGCDEQGIPDCVNLEVADSRAFSCENWIWQGSIFYRWIQCPQEGSDSSIGKSFKTAWVQEWAWQRLPVPRIVKKLQGLDWNKIEGPVVDVPSVRDAVFDYLRFLQDRSYLRYIGSGFLRVQHNGLDSPRTPIAGRTAFTRFGR
jgi:hypothetical protein